MIKFLLRHSLVQEKNAEGENGEQEISVYHRLVYSRRLEGVEPSCLTKICEYSFLNSLVRKNKKEGSISSLFFVLGCRILESTNPEEYRTGSSGRFPWNLKMFSFLSGWRLQRGPLAQGEVDRHPIGFDQSPSPQPRLPTQRFDS